MESAETRQSTFSVGEIISPLNLEAQFRVKSLGTHGMCVTRVSTKVIVPKAPFLVSFKNVLFKVVGWHGRDFTLHTVKEQS